VRTNPIPDIGRAALLALVARYEVTPEGCWNFTGNITDGRGRVSIDGRSYYAYRISYTAHVGAIPPGLLICHHCDNPQCINPDHLYAGTSWDNSRDCRERGRLVTPKVAGGAEHHAAGLTDAQADELVRRYAAGEATQAELAMEYGIAQSSVGRVIRGETQYGTTLSVARGRGRKAFIQPCGTRAGWYTHRRRGEPACVDCLAANAEYMRAYKAGRRLRSAA
jgi:hypothetical protein